MHGKFHIPWNITHIRIYNLKYNSYIIYMEYSIYIYNTFPLKKNPKKEKILSAGFLFALPVCKKRRKKKDWTALKNQFIIHSPRPLKNGFPFAFKIKGMCLKGKLSTRSYFIFPFNYSFHFDFYPNGILFGPKRKGKLSPRSYSIQFPPGRD